MRAAVTREREETASRDEPLHRWLAASAPLAIDDDPDWDDPDSEPSRASLARAPG